MTMERSAAPRFWHGLPHALASTKPRLVVPIGPGARCLTFLHAPAYHFLI